jgi:hypothetical protein
MAISGRFIPKNPHKYAGNPNNIMFRSTWELRFMQFIDSKDSILKWASEEIKIPYVSPLDGLVHHYFPDFVIVYTDKSGAIQKEIIEIKPASQSIAERAKSDHDKAALLVNIAKWEFASRFAAQRGMTFRVLTEDSLFKQSQKKQMAKKPTTGRKPSKSRPGRK